MRLADLTYEDRLEHAFGHEVRIQQAAWFLIMSAIGSGSGPAVAVATSLAARAPRRR